MSQCRCDSATHPSLHEPGRCQAEAATRDGYCQACVSEIMGRPDGSIERGETPDDRDPARGRTSS